MITQRISRTPAERGGRSLFREEPKTKQRQAPSPRGFRSAALILDTRSGRGRTVAAYALDHLRLLIVPVAAAHAIDDPARLAETVKGALFEGDDLIVMGGGDGSVGSVVDSLAYTDPRSAFYFWAPPTISPAPWGYRSIQKRLARRWLVGWWTRWTWGSRGTTT